MDQPWVILNTMAWADDLYRAHNGVRDAKHLVNWANANPGLWKKYTASLEFLNG